MDNFLLGHLKDLANRCLSQDKAFASPFLDLPTQAYLSHLFNEGNIFGCPAFYLGGSEDYERARLIFLPSYLDKESFILDEIEALEFVTSLDIEPIAGKFASLLRHQDYLGAVMGLGIKREAVGDLRVEENKARLFCYPSIATLIQEGLSQVKNETVNVKPAKLFAPGFALAYEDKLVSLASLRLDAILSQVFPLSRSLAKSHIEEGNVTYNGEINKNPDQEVSQGDVISLYRKGKIALRSIEGSSKKGRILVTIRRYL